MSNKILKFDRSVRSWCRLLFLFVFATFSWSNAYSQDCVKLSSDTNRAEQILLECAERQPDNPQTYLALAQLYALDEFRDRGKSRKYLDKAAKASDNAVFVLEKKLQLARQGIHRPMPIFMLRMQRVDLAKKILRATSESAIAFEELGLNEMSKYLVTRNRLKFDVTNKRGSEMGTLDREVFSPDRLNLDVIEQQLGPLVTLDSQAQKSYALAVDFFKRSLNANPEQYEVFNHLLELYFLEKDFHSAMASVTKMQGLFDDRAETWFLAAAVMHRLDNSDVASGMILRGMQLLTDLDKHQYENISMLLSEDQQIQYDLKGQNFADYFWSVRDPVLSTSVNERKVEHVVRISIADLIYDEGTGKLGRETERGRTYIRYGDPVKDSTIDGIVYRGDSPGIMNNSGTTIQMWNYGRFTLAFERIDYTEQYRLYSPSATAFNSYFDFADAVNGDYVVAARELSRNSPELYRYRSGAQAIPVEWRQSSFKSAGEGEDRVIAFTIPIDSTWHMNAQKVDLSSNLFSWSKESGTWEKKGFKSQLYESDKRPIQEFSGYFDYAMQEESESVALEIFANGGDAVGLQRLAHKAKGFTGSKLSLSDILLASFIEEDHESSSKEWRRGDLSIIPWGAQTFDRTARPYIYFEVYGLQSPDYAVEVSFRKKKKERKGVAKVLNLFQGNRDAVAASYTAQVTKQDDFQYLQLDLPKDEGDYEVLVTVYDSGKEESSSINIRIR